MDVSMDEDGALECWNYDTHGRCDVEDTECTVPAYGHLRIRVVFKPLAVGPRTWQLILENSHNADNTVAIEVSALVASESHENELVMTNESGDVLGSGSALQFGDCYVGRPTEKSLFIRNTTKVPLRIYVPAPLRAPGLHVESPAGWSVVCGLCRGSSMSCWVQTSRRTCPLTCP